MEYDNALAGNQLAFLLEELGGWVSMENTFADDARAAAQADAALAQGFDSALLQNAFGWLTSVSAAGVTLGNARLDGALTWTNSIAGELQTLADGFIDNAVAEVNAGADALQTFAGSQGNSLLNWAAANGATGLVTTGGGTIGTGGGVVAFGQPAGGSQGSGSASPGEWYNDSDWDYLNLGAYPGIRAVINWIAGYKPPAPDVPIRPNRDADGLPGGAMRAGSLGTWYGSTYGEAGEAAGRLVDELGNQVTYAGGSSVASSVFAFGIDTHLDDFSRKNGAASWKLFAKSDPMHWKSKFLDIMNDPKSKVLFNLDGVDVWGGVGRASRGAGGATDWELLQIMQNKEWWNRITWIKNGAPVSNPFQ